MFQLDFASRVPIYEQLCQNVIKLACAEVFKPGDKLPPVRTLATQLGVNPNTVAKAYRMLEADGYIYSTVGRGSFLSDKLSKDSAYKVVALNEFNESAKNAHLFGVSEEELINTVHKIYQGGEKLD